MTMVENTLRRSAGKHPQEIIHALYLAGYAIVPREMTMAQQGRRSLSITKDHVKRYAAVVEEGRAR